MSQINVNRIKDSNEGAPDFPSGVNVSGITSTVTLGVTNLNPTNVNVSGVVTATTLDGNLLATGTPTLGLGVTINTSGVNISGVATAGIVSATTLYGNGANITGIALTLAPLNYNPAVNSQSSHIAKASGIGLTFNQGVKAGSGNVTLSLANAGVAGTVVENFGVGNSVSYSAGPYGTVVTITPTADLTVKQDYHLSYPSGAFTNLGGEASFVGTAYTFKARALVNQLWMWGNNEKGVLGQNQQDVHYSSPVQVPGASWSKFSVGGWHTWATRTDGTLWAWGDNGSGRLGHNNLTHYSSPTQIPGTTWNGSISASYVNSYAVKTDGTLWAIGSGSQGRGGWGDTNDRSSPTQIGSGTDWSAVTSALYSAWAVKTDGTLWAWGRNTNGPLGQNNTTDYSSPRQVPGTTWTTKMAAGHSRFHAIKTDGTLWGIGNGEYGQLVINTGGNPARYSSPVQIPGTWTSVYSSKQAIYSIKSDGTLWSWGYNNKGQLGLNDTTQRSSPVQIPGTTWSELGAGSENVAAVKTDGTAWGWGKNPSGALGQNNRTEYSSPVQIPGTTWSKAYSNFTNDPGGVFIITRQV